SSAPTEGSSGVVRHLCSRMVQRSLSSRMKSVNVPPMSKPMRQRVVIANSPGGLARCYGRLTPARSVLAPEALPAQQLPAVHRDGLSGDPIGERRGPEQDDVRDLLGVPQPAERNALEDPVIELRIVALALLPGAAGELDRAGRHAIDADALTREHCRLGRRVIEERGLDRGVGRAPG